MNNKDLIAQYVDTGLKIPEAQVVQLPNWASKTYIRKRVIATAKDHTLEFYEIKLLGDSGMKKYFETINSDRLNLLFRNQDRIGGINALITTYIDNVSMKGNFHFNSVLEYISDENKDKFINLYLDNNISNMAGHEISNIIMNSNKPIPLMIRMFTNEHVLSIMKSRIIYYIEDRVGVTHFLNQFNSKTALRLSELFIEKSDEDHVNEVIIKNLINIDFDDSISEDLISMLLYAHKDIAVKLLVKNLSGKKLISIFKNIDYYVGEYNLGPIGRKLAIKYGSIEDLRPTFKEVYDTINDEGTYYGEEENNKDKFIEVDILSNPLPPWAKDVNAKAGFMYHDSTMGGKDMYGLSRKDVDDLIKKQIPKIFDLKK